jgi:hypothetical protein
LASHSDIDIAVTEEVQRHFEQAAECVEGARVFPDNNRLAATAARIYCAMFRAATQLQKRPMGFVDACRKLTP